MLNLLHPWVNKQRRVFSAESYFVLVKTCGELRKCGLRFIVVVETETRGFCMEKLTKIEFSRRSLWKGYFTLDNEKEFDKFALIWVDRYRSYFISNISSLKPGMLYAKERLGQLDGSPNKDPVCVEFEINQPMVAERYYSINSNICESNCTRQDDFQLEMKLQTKDFCMEKLTKIEFSRRSLWKGYFTLDNEKEFDKFALIWVDRYRSYFISNISSLKPGMLYAKERLGQLDGSPNKDPVCVEFEINQPMVAERYYSINSNICESNCTRQDDFQLEMKLQTKDWSIIVNNLILRMNGVDTYYLGKDCNWWDDRNPAEFYYNI